MKNLSLCLLSVVSLIACQKDQPSKEEQKKESTMNIVGVNTNDKKIVSLNLTSMKKTTSPIGSYYLGSTLFDPGSKSFGYSTEHSTFLFINLLTGNTTNEIPLPFECLTQTVIDTDDSCLIGLASNKDSMFIVKIKINSGVILSQHRLEDIGNGVNACAYFYNDEQNKYFIIGRDNSLLTIDPNNGSFIKTLPMPEDITNVTYDKKGNRLIGFSYDSGLDSNYLIAINIETGKIISKTTIKERNDYYGCVSEFDSESDCYITVTAKNEIQFIDIQSGQTKKKFPLDFDIAEFSFWRN